MNKFSKVIEQISKELQRPITITPIRLLLSAIIGISAGNFIYSLFQ